MTMRVITTTGGTPIEIYDDADVLALLETVSRDLVRHKELEYGFEDVDREFQHLVGQLTEAELRQYLKESLFMSFNRYEIDRLSQLVQRANQAREE
jgi:hypothetical protein